MSVKTNSALNSEENTQVQKLMTNGEDVLNLNDESTQKLLDARETLTQLPMSCRVKLSRTDPNRQLSSSACHLYQILVDIPGIFDVAQVVKGDQLAGGLIMPLARSIEPAMLQLEVSGLAELPDCDGEDQKIKLLVPDWIRDFHEDRLCSLWHFYGRHGDYMSLDEGYSFWTGFVQGHADYDEWFARED